MAFSQHTEFECPVCGLEWDDVHLKYFEELSDILDVLVESVKGATLSKEWEDKVYGLAADCKSVQ